MKKKLLLALLMLLALGIGSHYLPPLPVDAPELPEIEKLDEFLVKSESQFDDITDGAEKTIIWTNKKNKKSEFSVVYLHGYSATRQESAPVSDLLAKQLNANAFHTRLTGHGREDSKMETGSLRAWKKDALEAYGIGKLIGDKVIIVSVSTGATLSTWLAAQENTQAIVAQLMISPNFDVPNQDAYLLDLPLGIGVKIAEWTTGKYHQWTPKNELQEKYWSTKHPIKSVRPMVQLLKEVKKIDKQILTMPTLMVFSKKDTVISTTAIEENFKQWGGNKKQIVQFNDSADTHVLASEIVSPGSVKPMLDILTNFLYQHQVVPRPQTLSIHDKPVTNNNTIDAESGNQIPESSL